MRTYADETAPNVTTAATKDAAAWKETMIIVDLFTYIALWLLLLGNAVESYIERSMLMDMDILG